eukprot:7465375-Prorocentrum_lima.AAC.1
MISAISGKCHTGARAVASITQCPRILAWARASRHSNFATRLSFLLPVGVPGFTKTIQSNAGLSAQRYSAHRSSNPKHR